MNNIGRSIRLLETRTYWNKFDKVLVSDEDEQYLHFKNKDGAGCYILKSLEGTEFSFLPLSEHQEYYQENKEAILEQKRQYRSNLKADVVKALGGKCRNCGYDKIPALDVKGEPARDKQSYTAFYNRVWAIIDMFPNHNYFLMCANCQRLEEK